jgi:hypothetical protein
MEQLQQRLRSGQSGQPAPVSLPGLSKAGPNTPGFVSTRIESKLSRHFKTCCRAARCDYYMFVAGLLHPTAYRKIDVPFRGDVTAFQQQMAECVVQRVDAHTLRSLTRHYNRNKFGNFVVHAAVNAISGAVPSLYFLARLLYFTTQNERKVVRHVRNFKEAMRAIGEATQEEQRGDDLGVLYYYNALAGAEAASASR